MTQDTSYWANLHYMSSKWFEANLKGIFSPSSDESFACMVSGLSYSPATSEVYKILLEHDVFNRAVMLPETREGTRDRLIERIALAYLWEQETFDTPQMRGLFVSGREKDLIVVAAFLWSVNTQELTEQQIVLAAAFWRQAASWALQQNPKHKELLATIARLICYLKMIEGSDVDLIIGLAPYASEAGMSYFFSKELKRLVPQNTRAVAQAAIAFLKENGPEYDFESTWLDISKALVDGGCKLEAIEIAEIMRGQPGFDELWRSIR